MNDMSAHLEMLSEVVGTAARYGPSPSLEKQYTELRLWMLGHWKPQELRWHRGDAFDDFLSVPTLERQLMLSGDRLAQRIESMRTVLHAQTAQTQTSVH